MVRIDHTQPVHSTDDHHSLVEQRRGALAVPIGKLEINITKLEHFQRPLDELIHRLERLIKLRSHLDRDL